MSNVSLGGSLSLTTNNTPTRVGERVATEAEIATIPAPYIGLVIYIEDKDQFVYVKSLKSKKIGSIEIKNALVDKYEPLSSGETNLNWIDVV